MKHLPFLFCWLLLTGCSGLRTYQADEAPVRFVGRTETTPRGVSFDWSGTWADIRFKGSYLAMRTSDTGRNYFNLTIDGMPCEKFTTTGDSCLVVLFDAPESRGEHLLRIQKATEGEQGCVTIHDFTTDGRLLPVDNCARPRHIEFYGDSLTCGYGTESQSGDEPFKPETENCCFTYAAYTAARFDADYNLVCHSGRGLIRNYGDTAPHSDPATTMSAKAFQLYDMQPEPLWDFTKSPYRPDAIVITLSTNDFSPQTPPSGEAFAAGYRHLIERLRTVYEEEVPVLCVVHAPEAVEVVRQAVADLPATTVADISWGVYNRTSDLGASEHPNRFGQEKMAAIVIDRLAELTGWSTVKP